MLKRGCRLQLPIDVYYTAASSTAAAGTIAFAIYLCLQSDRVCNERNVLQTVKLFVHWVDAPCSRAAIPLLHSVFCLTPHASRHDAQNSTSVCV